MNFITRGAFDPTLTKLDLSHSKIGPEEAKVIANALKDNQTLKSLDISSNLLGPKGTQYIAEALYTNRALRTLDLSDNGLKGAGIVSICKALLVNCTLKNVSFERNYIYDTSCDADVATLLESSKTLKSIRLAHTFVDSIRIIDAVKTNGILVKFSGFRKCYPYIERNRIARFDVKRVRFIISEMHYFPHDLAQLIDAEIWSSRGDSAWWPPYYQVMTK